MKRALHLAIGMVAPLLLLPHPAAAAHLDPGAQHAFDQYSAAIEVRLERQHDSSETFIAVLNGDLYHPAQTLEGLESGTVVIQSVLDHPKPVPGGLIHHWRGAAYVRGAKSKDMVALLRDYNDLPRNYGPEIQTSSVVWERGGAASVAIRMKQKKVITVVLDGEYDLQTRTVSAGSGSSSSRSRHIWEVEGAGSANERRMKEGDDDGFLWRLNSYWSFQEVPGGLVIECEAVSLTRDIPSGLSWLAGPVVEELPRESLEFTLQATRNALTKAAKENEKE
jgi:hypothetical protein